MTRLPMSNAANARLHSLVPGGAHTYAKGDDQYPEAWRPVISRGRGSHVWDVDGNEYVEYGIGLRVGQPRPRPPAVVEAVRSRAATAAATSPGRRIVELDAAEQFLATVTDRAEMVKFAKNGSDATTAAVRLARADHRPVAVSSPAARPAVLLDRRLVHRHHADGRRHPGRRSRDLTVGFRTATCQRRGTAAPAPGRDRRA